MKKENMIRLTIRLPRDVHTRLKEISNTSDLSINKEMVRLLRMALGFKIEKFDGFWDLPAEARVALLLDGYCREVTREILEEDTDGKS